MSSDDTEPPVVEGELVGPDDSETADARSDLRGHTVTRGTGPGTATAAEILAWLQRPTPLQTPPAVRCKCGKNGTAFAHGLIPGRSRPFTCEEVLEIRGRVYAPPRSLWARLVRRVWGGDRHA